MGGLTVFNDENGPILAAFFARVWCLSNSWMDMVVIAKAS
jgi:predicted heme/steroid binding protein